MNVRPKKEIRFNMRMTHELMVALEQNAWEQDRTVSDLAHRALEEKFVKKIEAATQG